MAQNKNALLRYRTIDRCLRNTGRRWTLQDLVDACSDALYDFEGRSEMVGVRTVQLDIQMMRSDRLGYNAPIEVYERKYYRYSDPAYTISARPLSKHDVEIMERTIDLLRQFDEFDGYHEMADLVGRLQDKVAGDQRRSIVDFERNPNLRGLEFLNPLYDAIAAKKVVRVNYQSFNAAKSSEIVISPYLLKEYRNRWFLFGSRTDDNMLFNLALDRILGFELCDELPYHEDAKFTDDYFDDVVGVSRPLDTAKETVIIRAERSQANYILTKPLHHSQRTLAADTNDGSITFRLEVIINYELVARLLSLGPDILVVSPKSLADKMRDLYRRGAEAYEK